MVEGNSLGHNVLGSFVKEQTTMMSLLSAIRCAVLLMFLASSIDAENVTEVYCAPCLCLPIPAPGKGLLGCFGDVMNTTLALNASQASSYIQMADNDSARLEQYRPCFEKLALQYCFPYALLAAWASRESRAGLSIQHTGGYNTAGEYGLFACNVTLIPGCQNFVWDSCEYVDFMLHYLLSTLYGNIQFLNKYASPENKLRGALAAYDAGLGAIPALTGYANIDALTTNQDYSSDILIRAQRLITDKGWQYQPSTGMSDKACLEREGQCKSTNSNCRGEFWDGLCGGNPSKRKCCVRNSKPEDKECVQNGGMCRETTSQCPSGQFWKKKSCGQTPGGNPRYCCKPGSQSGDDQCQAQNGNCIDTSSAICNGTIWTKKCAGHGRQCCIPDSTPEDTECLNDDGICQNDTVVCQGTDSPYKCGKNGYKCCLPFTDAPCKLFPGGVCQPVTETCNGTYIQGSLCVHSPDRQCCVPATINITDALCTPTRCENGGTCDDSTGRARCTCPPGFTGSRCQSVIEAASCDPNPCQNGGTCKLKRSSKIVCRCVVGYYGNYCQHSRLDKIVKKLYAAARHMFKIWKQGGKPRKGGQQSSTSCDPNPCKNGGSCLSVLGTIICQCTDKYTGLRCETKKAASCDPNPCQNGGTCKLRRSKIVCRCSTGYYGNYCQHSRRQQSSTSCDPNPCKNGGTCLAVLGTITCQCKNKYTGPRCETKIKVNGPKCSANSCRNGGTCSVVNGKIKCACPAGYRGRRCQRGGNRRN